MEVWHLVGIVFGGLASVMAFVVSRRGGGLGGYFRKGSKFSDVFGPGGNWGGSGQQEPSEPSQADENLQRIRRQVDRDSMAPGAPDVTAPPYGAEPGIQVQTVPGEDAHSQLVQANLEFLGRLQNDAKNGEA